jgi:hypothetical protein
VGVTATRAEQSQEVLRVAREVLENAPDPAIRGMVKAGWRRRSDEIAFSNGVTIRALPAHAAAARGVAMSLAIMDEAGHAIAGEGPGAARQLYRAVQPATRQFGSRGRVLITSTPGWPTGLLWDLEQAAKAGVADDVLVIRRATWDMNPTITRASLEREFREDPAGAAAEYACQWLEGTNVFTEREAVLACIDTNRRQLPPVQGVHYWAACDPAFAAGGDAFALAIGHRQGQGLEATNVIDLVTSWRGKKSPLNSDAVLDEIAATAAAYGVRRVTSDQHALVPVTDGLRKRGLMVDYQHLSSESKADVMGELQRCINTGRLELPDDPELIGELLGLEVRPTPTGKPRIQAARGGHDDRVMAVATCVFAMASRAGSGLKVPVGMPWGVAVPQPGSPRSAAFRSELHRVFQTEDPGYVANVVTGSGFFRGTGGWSGGR